MTKKRVWNDIFQIGTRPNFIRNCLKIFVYVFLVLWVIFEIWLMTFSRKEGLERNGKDVGGFNVRDYVKARLTTGPDGKGDFNSLMPLIDNDNFKDIPAGRLEKGPNNFDVFKGLWNAVKVHENTQKTNLTNIQMKIVLCNDKINGIISNIIDNANELYDYIDAFNPSTVYDEKILSSEDCTLDICKIRREFTELKVLLNSITNSDAIKGMNFISESLTELNNNNFYDRIPDDYNVKLETSEKTIADLKNNITTTIPPILDRVLNYIKSYISNPLPEGNSKLSSLYEELIDIQQNIQTFKININKLKDMEKISSTNSCTTQNFTALKTAVRDISEDQKYLNDVLAPYKRTNYYNNDSLKERLKELMD